MALHKDRHKRAVALTGLAELHAEMGEGGQARQAWRQALEIFDGLGDTSAADEVRTRLAGPRP